MTQRGERDIPRFTKGQGCLANEFLAFEAAVGKFCNLLVDIDIDIEKPCRVLVNDALLLAIEVFPDIMRTLSNVTMDMAVTTTIARAEGDKK